MRLSYGRDMIRESSIIAERELFEDLAGPGLALGIDSQYNYVTNRKEGLKEGQIIVLGTDGIWEAQNPDGEMFGKEAICRLIQENADAEANALLDVIINSLDHFRDVIGEGLGSRYIAAIKTIG